MPNANEGRPRFFEKPVAWLLGQQLIGALKGALLYAAYGKKLDPRDWMTGEAFSFDDASRANQTEFWFDYISDVGDGTKAMYSSAYLAMCRSLGTRLSANATDLPANPSQCEVTTTIEAGTSFSLPRGEFLLVGGDTAYHTAAYMTLVNRIQHPFKYAYEDLAKHGLISNDDPQRPIFGIPGNHDYYDQLDGFRRQFRKPVRPEGPLPPGRSGPENAQLTIAGFRRAQESSYVALRLPFGWWFWGLDTEPGLIDLRQRKFFQTVTSGEGQFQSPDKLIIATCSPSTVCGHLAPQEDPKVAASLAFLGLSLPFFPAVDAAGKPDLTQTGDAKLESGQCRLDLSGDVHHYARYWGPRPANGSATRKHNTAPAPSANSYASVVSGAGAAFHHPTTTYDNEICEQVLYPSETVSRAAIADRIVKFWNVITGGYIWLAGLIAAFVIFFGVTVPQSSRQFVSNIGFLNTLGLVSRETITPTIVQAGNLEPCKSVEPFFLWTALGVAPAQWQPPSGCTAGTPTFMFDAVNSWPVDLIIGQALIWIALIAIVATLVLTNLTKKIFTDESPYEAGPDPDRKLWPIIIVTTVLVLVGLFTVKPYHTHITPFGSSLIVFFSFFAALSAIILSLRYNEYLFKKSFVSSMWDSDWILPWVLWLVAIFIAACGLWFFGKNNLPAFLISDLCFVFSVIGLVFCVMVLPFKVGGDLLYTQPKWLQIIGKLLIAVWHLILQMFVPLVLIKTGNYVAWILAVILLFLPIGLAKTLVKKDSGFGLSLMWLVYGSVMLFLPWLTAKGFGFFGLSYAPVFATFSGWMALAPALLAGLVGAVSCCLWTGWYFAICFVFNGHNNEVGGAARIEEFKEFIRFRINSDGLTGYVIAVDDVSMIGEAANGRTMDGSDLRPRLVDVFHLRPKT